MPSAACRVPAEEWEHFVHEVQRHAGIDLKAYKSSQVQRRVEGLMLRSGVDHLRDYLRLLDREPDRRRDLQKCVTVQCRSSSARPISSRTWRQLSCRAC